MTERCVLNTEHGKISAMFRRQITKNVNSIFNCVNLTQFDLGGTLLYQNYYLNHRNTISCKFTSAKATPTQ